MIFFTGFPGFLGSELVPRILLRSAGATALCLVQPKFAELARQRAAEIEARIPELAGRIAIVEGDITSRIDAGHAEIVEIYHLAAVYDLAVSRALAMRVNVEGTRHVLEFAARQPRLRRLHYVSTCYVSGRYRGTFYERDLERGQDFNNFYEETKFLAEREVQRAMAEGLPATIYRPAVVVGDSATGATQKYDGPYTVMQWILRQPRIALLPTVGRTRRYTFNVVPRDFVIAAIDVLSAQEGSRGKVYQLADPEPLTIDATIDAIGAAAGTRILRLPLTKALAKGALAHLPGLYRLMRIPPSAVDYFVHPTTYDTAQATSDLAEASMTVPRFRDYLPRLVAFVRAHPEIGASGMA